MEQSELSRTHIYMGRFLMQRVKPSRMPMKGNPMKPELYINNVWNLVSSAQKHAVPLFGIRV
jgi:hypothetical protein